MNILILHRVPFEYLNYDRIIDHGRNDVLYIGEAKRMADLPAKLRCRRLVIDTGDFEGYVRVHSDDFRDIERVVAASSYNVKAAAAIRSFLGCPGMKPEMFAAVDDKVKMKRAVAGAGLRIPAFLQHDHVVADGLPVWRGKTVLKPRAETASRNVFMFPSFDEARDAILSPDFFATRRLDVAGFELEEFVDGPVWHFDGYVRNGLVELIQPSRYEGTCYRYAQGESIVSLQHDDETAAALASRYVVATGLDDSVFHLEMIQSGDEFVFLEIAPRTGGAGVNDATKLKTGVDLNALDIALQAGVSPPPLSRSSLGDRFGWYLIPGHLHAGQCCEVTTAYDHPAVIEAKIMEAGKPLEATISYNEWEVPFFCLIRLPDGLTPDQLKRSLDQCIAVQFVEAVR